MFYVTVHYNPAMLIIVVSVLELFLMRMQVLSVRRNVLLMLTQAATLVAPCYTAACLTSAEFLLSFWHVLIIVQGIVSYHLLGCCCIAGHCMFAKAIHAKSVPYCIGIRNLI